ncbi:MAG: DEAD/DEAH box helicase [Vulcanimicrobiota bacterium]
MALRVIKGFKPRDWAKAAYAKFLRSTADSFLVDACPGAGKTKFAVMVAVNELHRGAADRVDVVGPSVHICRQWAEEMAAWGVHLDSENDQESEDCLGRVFTYQRLGMGPRSLRTGKRLRRLVILDEIHHAGDNRTWGDALRSVFANAERRLLLSGTPFRSDANPIPFVSYTGGDHGVSISDYSYGYGEALRDGYCAPLYFPHHDGDFQWERGGEIHSYDLSTRLTRQMGADRLRTAFAPEGQFVTELLREAHQHLLQLRTEHPQAGGIVFGRDVENVRALAEVLERVSGIRPVTVTNDDKDATGRINRFRQGDTPWLVSVKMVSEGVDIPRLRVGVYLSPVQTEMFFRQAAGRLVRLVSGLEDQAGYLYIPSLPKLVEFAASMTSERHHAIGKVLGDGLLPGEAEERLRTEPDDEEIAYRFLSAVPERAGVVETSPTDKGGQTFFDFASDMIDEPEPVAPVNSGDAPEVTRLLAEQKLAQRRRGGVLSSLVNELYRSHKVPYAKIHAHLNSLQRVNGQSQCTLEQLEEREELLRTWLREGSPPQKIAR